jgi:hypothetical protein
MTCKRLQLSFIAPAIACVVAGMAACLLAAPPAPKATPLWPGAKYTTEDRDRAVERGLRFIYSAAMNPEAFRNYGHDLLFAFVNIATSNGNRRLAALARQMGRERAIEWRRQHKIIPQGAGATVISNLMYGSYSANRLGVTDRAFDRALLARAARFTLTDYMGFDPSREPPPDNYPGYSRRALFMEAMLDAYFGEEFGTAVEGRYSVVMQWLPQMRPYPPHRYNDQPYYDAIYMLTHVVYTFNHYNLSRVSPTCFPDEFAYLKSNLPAAIEDHDPETLGEYVDSLRAFGVDYSDARLREATEYILSAQNSDGSWGDPAEKDIYTRYHATWTGQGAIQEFHWGKAQPCPTGKAAATPSVNR